MNVLGWVLRKVLLPLLPFLLGASIRIIHLGKVSVEVFDGAELSFSMAMLSVLILENVNRLNDESLRDFLSSGFQVFATLFLALFAIQIYIEAEIASALSMGFENLRSYIHSGTEIPISGLQFIKDPVVAYSSAKIQRLWCWTIASTLMVIPLSVVVKIRYKLEN